MSPRPVCANCGEQLSQDKEGWYHTETGMARCPMEFWAIPREGK